MTLPCPFCSAHKKIVSETTEIYVYPTIKLQFDFKQLCPICGKVFCEMQDEVELNIVEDFYKDYLDKFKEQILN